MTKGYIVNHEFIEIPDTDERQCSEVENQEVEKSEAATEEVA